MELNFAGTFSEMEDAKDGGIYEMIDYFSSRKKILYVHFRNVLALSPNLMKNLSTQVMLTCIRL
ncbi:MAG: hypothetical protein Ct9H90mP2_02470 [Dehalococcoidia bacterium]|nr:MAG: hypothetical protein Ct9H90mP2_02470 [Dehalococcoidia bacterium]